MKVFFAGLILLGSNRIKAAALKGIGNGRMNISITIRLGILLKKL